MPLAPLFQKPHFMAECDLCHAIFDPYKGGVCRQCQRTLCGLHMHGSLVQKLRVYFGAPAVCVECRSGEGPAPTR